MMLPHSPQVTKRLYTLNEVADMLRVSKETIRRKVIKKEINAIEVTGAPKKQYRILHSELERWLGPDTVQELFVKPTTFDLPSLFEGMSDEEIDELVNKAKAWAREHTSAPKPEESTPTPDEIKAHFPKGRRLP